jgi:dihydrofolate reductase
MSSGRVGGETTRRTTTTCSSSPITRASRSRWRGARRSTSSPTGSSGRWSGAKESADGQDVRLWGGAQVIQQYLAAGLVDELELHIVPVLLGDGARLFDNLGDAEIELEQVRAVEAPGVTHLKYRVSA